MGNESITTMSCYHLKRHSQELILETRIADADSVRSKVSQSKTRNGTGNDSCKFHDPHSAQYARSFRVLDTRKWCFGPEVRDARRNRSFGGGRLDEKKWTWPFGCDLAVWARQELGLSEWDADGTDADFGELLLKPLRVPGADLLGERFAELNAIRGLGGVGELDERLDSVLCESDSGHDICRGVASVGVEYKGSACLRDNVRVSWFSTTPYIKDHLPSLVTQWPTKIVLN